MDRLNPLGAPTGAARLDGDRPIYNGFIAAVTSAGGPGPTYPQEVPTPPGSNWGYNVTVILPDYDGSRTFGPLAYLPLPAGNDMLMWPMRGDPCLVGFDEEGQPQLLWWRPNLAGILPPQRFSPSQIDTRLDLLEGFQLTALPVNPVHGQFARVSMTGSVGALSGVGVLSGPTIWTMRYDSMEQKWFPEGGPPLRASDNTTATCSWQTYAGFPGSILPSPRIVVPKGRYLLKYGSVLYSSQAASQNTYMQVVTADPGASDPQPESLRLRVSANSTDIGMNVMSERTTGEAVADTLFGFVIRNDVGTSSSNGRWMEISPIYMLPTFT